ncbi:MAG: EAL domain-containing protein [Lactimicrobium sp.]|jgi:diguanylate cyclase (GGDEF)-like protein|uniref:bifunctional diguanylate cyclase/phosphodiesterase n=1 Tax=Lactimicrobium sp. TaxID=2563780 RepID=UPI002F351054
MEINSARTIKDYLRLSKNKDLKQFMESQELLMAAAENNIRVSYVVSATLILIGVIGTFGLFIFHDNVALFPKIPSILIYLILMTINTFHIVHLLHLNEATDKKSAIHNLNVTYCSFLLNALLSGLTLFSTQTGSSLFFELVIVMVLVAILPFYRRKHIAPIIIFSIATTLGCLLFSHTEVAWQDGFDLGIFYFICVGTMLLRRIWFAQTTWLQVQLSRTNSSLVKENRTDTLTELNSRGALRQDFPAYTGAFVCMAMMDIDDFKRVNDVFGHVYGDSLLKHVGDGMIKDLQSEKIKCYRYGGDEFLVISRNVAFDEFASRMEKFRKDFAKKMPDGTMSSFSIGISYGQMKNERSIRSCLQQADDCLYEAKALGKNQIVSRPFSLDYIKPSEHALSNEKDRITGLPSLSSFYHDAEDVIKDSPDWKIIFFDIDRFQSLNQTNSFKTGDQVLNRTAKLLQESFPGDLITRSESDHFLVLTQKKDDQNRIETVQQEISRYLPHNYIFLRAGVYQHHADSGTSDLRGCVDMAHAACDTLRNQTVQSIRLFDEELYQSMQKEAFVLSKFNDAIVNGDFVPYFQPIVGGASGKTCGFEVLSRWNDPEHGMISPGDFMPVLENSHDAYRLDFYMLEKGCQLLADMNADRRENLFFSFNLSRTDFDVCDVPARINRIVSRYEIPHRALRLEITESAIIDSPKIQNAIRVMQKEGYQIWLDDFGTDMSSLSALKDYKVDGVKLDMEFMRSFHENARSSIIIRALIEMSHSMGTEVVVEGVETREQLSFVRLCGGNYIQGFYYARPMPWQDLIKSRFWTNYVRMDQLPYYQKANTTYITEANHYLTVGRMIPEIVMEVSGSSITMLRLSDAMEKFLSKHTNVLQTVLCQQVLRKAAESNVPVWQCGKLDGQTYLVLAMRLGISPDNSKAIIQMEIYHSSSSEHDK